MAAFNVSKNLCRPVKILFATLVIFAVSACSNKLAYRYLDWGLMWQLEKYIDLNKSQKAISKSEFDKFHAWHKRTQLPLYANYLETLKPILAQPGITGKKLHDETDKLQLLLKDSIDYFLPFMTALAASMNEKQVDEFLIKFDKRTKTFKKKYVDISKRKQVKKRAKDLIKETQRLTGKLSSKQKKWIYEWAATAQNFEPLLLDQRKIWRENYKTLLRNRSDMQATQKELAKLMRLSNDDWLPEIKRMTDINQTQVYELVAKILNDLSPDQRKHMIKNVDKYIALCRDIHATHIN